MAKLKTQTSYRDTGKGKYISQKQAKNNENHS